MTTGATMPALPPLVIRAVQVALTLGLLVALWHIADGAEALVRLRAADPGWLLAAGAALTLQTVLSALRWRLTAAQLGIAIDRVAALREYYLSQIVNQILPGGVLGDAGRAVRARAQAGLVASGQAVLFERLAGQIAILAVLALALAMSVAVPGGVDWPAWLVGPVALALAGIAALPLMIWALGRAMPGRAGRSLGGFGQAFARAMAAPGVRGPQVALSLGTALCNIAAFAFCARAIGSDLGIAAALVLVPIVLFTMVVPLTVSGWGLREGAAAALFPVAGATASEGLAASVAFGLVMLAALLPGVVLLGTRPTIQPMKP